MSELSIKISVKDQKLSVFKEDNLCISYSVSTAKNGIGQRQGSYCTPIGKHKIYSCIGENKPIGAVFKAREWTGEIWNTELSKQYPDRDWILTRILWLEGCEPSLNKFGGVDSKNRYIYIHGTAETELMGVPLSKGCVRMQNQDILELYELVKPGTPVMINP